MSNGEFIGLIMKDLIAYRKMGVMTSVRRNMHMNDYRGEAVHPDVFDAILVDFVNFIAGQRGMDYGLYTRDLDK